MFGLRWLRMAILRSAGLIVLHDKEAAFAAETSQLQGLADPSEARLDRIASLTAFKAVLLEGLEVVFVVVAPWVLRKGCSLLQPPERSQPAAQFCCLVWQSIVR
ncbi:putative membrane protein [Bradyrhizobium sp. GM5.1]